MKNFLVFWLLLGSCALGSAQDNGKVHPPVKAQDIHVLKRARAILKNESVWNRHDNRVCPVAQKTHSLYCALQEATKEEYGSFEHRAAALQEVRFVIDDITFNKEYDHRLMDYNNDPSTTLRDVRQVIDLAQELISMRLRVEQQATASKVP